MQERLAKSTRFSASNRLVRTAQSRLKRHPQLGLLPRQTDRFRIRAGPCIRKGQAALELGRPQRESAKTSFKEKMQSKKSYAGGHERTFITKHGEERIFVIHDFLSFDKDKNVKSVHTTM